MLTQAFNPDSQEFIEVTPGIGMHVHGWEDGRPIVMIPGWPLTEQAFDYQLSLLTCFEYLALNLTLRRLKQTGSPWQFYDYYLFADDIVAVASQIDLNAITLCGGPICGALAIHDTTVEGDAEVTRLALYGVAASRQGSSALASSFGQEARRDSRPTGHFASGSYSGMRRTPALPGVASWFLCKGRSNGR